MWRASGILRGAYFQALGLLLLYLQEEHGPSVVVLPRHTGRGGVLRAPLPHPASRLPASRRALTLTALAAQFDAAALGSSFERGDLCGFGTSVSLEQGSTMTIMSDD